VRRLALFGLCLGALCLPATSHAAFSGANGKIAYECNGSVCTIEPDGSGLTTLATGVAPTWSPDGSQIAFVDRRSNGNFQIWKMFSDGSGASQVTNFAMDGCVQDPAWSPDGNKIAFWVRAFCGGTVSDDIFVINADGSGLTNLTSGFLDQNGNNSSEQRPAWSPDGTKIAFQSGDVWTMNADGSNPIRLTTHPSGATNGAPNWSPDGTKIVFQSDRDAPNTFADSIYVMNADGTGQTRLTVTPSADRAPVWSPDGQRIAYARCTGPDPATSCLPDIYTMNADGTQQAPVSPEPGSDRDPDWGVGDGYPRPKGATPIRVSLVPAFAGCTAPNSTHGSPLAFPSCNPPVQTSSYLTVGTPDTNGEAANSIASERIDAILGNPSTPANEADVRFTISATDVRRKSDLSPYPGTLEARNTLRITDRSPTDNVAATTQDIPFSVSLRCALPPMTTFAGSSCSAGTTANALVPGVVVEGRRTIWALDQVKLYDGGADGDASTTGDNTLFMDEGVFIP
jgi:Tol biopolymer transport system component